MAGRDFDKFCVQSRNKLGPGSAPVFVGDICGLLESGMNSRAICSQYPDIRPESVALARAFIIAADHEYYMRVISRKPSEKYHGIVDENLSARYVLPAMPSLLGPATHVNFEGLDGAGDGTGLGDMPLWQWTVNKEKDYLLTCDVKLANSKADLTGIAIKHVRDILSRPLAEVDDKICLNDMPVIIQISGRSHEASSFRALRLLTKNIEEVRSYLDSRTAPYINLSDKGVRAPLTYTEIYAEEMRSAPANGDVISKRDAFIKRNMDVVLRGKPRSKMGYSQFKAVEQMVRLAASLVFMHRHDGEEYKNGRKALRQQEKICAEFFSDRPNP